MHFWQRFEKRDELFVERNAHHIVAHHDIPDLTSPSFAHHVEEAAHHADHDDHECNTHRNRPDGDEGDDPRGEVTIGEEWRVHE